MTEPMRDTATLPFAGSAQPFSGPALTALLAPGLRVLGLGEPTHGVDAFLQTRNELFRHLVEAEGFRSIALESDCLAALAADAWAADGEGTLDQALDHGFSHGLGAAPGNRELLRWMRESNASRPPEDRLHLYGLDGPLEMTGAASPGPALTALHDYLAAHLTPVPWSRTDLTDLCGPEHRWSSPSALMDPAHSVGRTPEARRLRLAADDLTAQLAAHRPRLTAATSPEAYWRAALHARTATGLLRYHAALADDSPSRLSTVSGLRDLMMADNLDAVLDRESRRGPALVFAHNSHLQRGVSSMRMGGHHLEWWSAGALTAARHGDRYRFAASTFGTRGAGTPAPDIPAPDTVEGLLATLPHPRSVIDPTRFAAALERQPAPRVPADHTYAGLDPDALRQLDAIVYLREV